MSSNARSLAHVSEKWEPHFRFRGPAAGADSEHGESNRLSMFHVKHRELFRVPGRSARPAPLLLAPSLADAEVPEDHVEDVFDIDAPGQPPERSRREPQFLRQ